MSINQWLEGINNPDLLLAFFVCLPLFTLLIGFFHIRRSGDDTSLRYVYSVLTYTSAITGTFSISLISYALFFTKINLLDVNFFIYFLPLISMVVTLMIIGKQAKFSRLPGFNRLSGLITLLLVTFAIILFVSKSRIFVGFFGSMESLLGLGVFVYFLLRWSLKRMTN